MTPSKLPEPQQISPDIIGESEQFLIYGKPKTGKTFLALTLPPPILFISIGQNREAKTYYSKPFQEKHAANLPPDQLRIHVGMTSQEVKDLTEAALEGDYAGTGFQFNSIVLDNISRLIAAQLQVAFDLSFDRAASGSGNVTKTAKAKQEEYGAIVPQQQDYGVAKSIMQAFLSELMAVDKHLAVIAHEYDTFTSGPGQTQILSKVEPNFIGKDRQDMGNLFDNVWRMDKDGSRYIARTEEGTDPKGFSIQAGSRIGGVVAKDYLNPNLGEAIEKFRAHAQKMAAKADSR